MNQKIRGPEFIHPQSLAEALGLLHIPDKRFMQLLPYTSRLRERAFGNRVSLCAIINAKSGRCGEDCAFCAQSAYWPTRIEEYELLSEHEIVSGARRARGMQASRFSIVTSGKGITRAKEQDTILRAVERIRKEIGIHPCASLGIVNQDFLRRLKDAGLERYHHNLETSRSFFHEICTTHDYEEDMEVIRLAKDAGLEACCGGVFGLGEGPEQRIELLMTLKELDVDAVPINFLHPIPGTPLEGRPLLEPRQCIRIIALARLILPETSVIICGGREKNLREMQDKMFAAGADGLMTGDYLTTKGRSPAEDLKMLKEKGLEPVPP
jgi:biotin synthase